MSSERVKVTVGVSGGVAAYKAVELVRLLQEAGYDPHVVMTRGAEEFVRPLTFEAISGHRVIGSLWGEQAGTGSAEGEREGHSSVEHIEQAQTTRVLVVAPATAHTLAKMALGLADDFLSTMYLAMTGPVIVAPAMNVKMWEHAAVQANVATLRARGVRVVAPGDGYLACGMVGGGRLAALEEIVAAVGEALAGPEREGGGAGISAEQMMAAERPGGAGARELGAVQAGNGFDAGLDMGRGVLGSSLGVARLTGNGLPGTRRGGFEGETVIVTAGGTREAIDPVRYIGNRSSGRMGYALAEAAKRRGAKVVLISAPTGLEAPAGVEMVQAVNVGEMRAAMMERLKSATVVIMAAAVSDYRVRSVAAQKIKREAARAVLLELEPTEDILREVVERRLPGTLVIGFAAETQDVMANGRAKLERKGVDAVVVNDVSVSGVGFDAEENAGSFLTREGEVEIPRMSKMEMAERILDEVAKLKA